MIITKHKELCDWLIAKIEKEKFSERLVKIEQLQSLEQDVLLTFFSHDSVLGVFVACGDYENVGEEQSEDVKLFLVLGQRNLSSSTAALGTDDAFGVLDLLEELRTLFSNQTIGFGTNIEKVTPKKWNHLLSKDDLAVIGLEVDVALSRILPFPEL